MTKLDTQGGKILPARCAALFCTSRRAASPLPKSPSAAQQLSAWRFDDYVTVVSVDGVSRTHQSVQAKWIGDGGSPASSRHASRQAGRASGDSRFSSRNARKWAIAARRSASESVGLFAPLR